jgi:hypothetical protein
VLDVSLPHAAQFGGFDDPVAAQHLYHALAFHVERQIIREPILTHGQDAERR